MGRYRGSVRSRALLALAVVGLSTMPACADRDVPVTPSEGFTVSGTIRTADGAPCSACPVMITSTVYPMPEIAQTTGPEGHYSWVVPGAGSFVLETRVDGTSVTRTVDVTATTHGVDISPDSTSRSPAS